MDWEDRRRSGNVQDRRGKGAGRVKAAVPLGCGSIILMIAFIALGGDPQVLMQILGSQNAPVEPRPSTPVSSSAEEEQLKDFMSVVLADTETAWAAIFAQSGKRYREPTLVIFNDAVQSACGLNSSAVGPFYCPGDQQIYIDLGFFQQLSSRFGAPGDFAQAYVLSHEVGHHVQTLLGVSDEVNRLRLRASQVESNQLSVRQELQADCFAGVWANHAGTQRQLLEQGDIEEGLRAASAIGDDTLQKQAQGHAVPESFTHGTSQQRVRWFSVGMQYGDVNRCDTFSTSTL